MKDGPDIARIAALIGDPARANMLVALLSGRALTATELAHEAGVTPQTASTHLARLTEGGLLRQEKQGRHKYLALANEDVGHLLETLMGVAAGSGHLRSRIGPRDAALRKARICYRHLAGEMGTQLYDSLQARGLLDCENGPRLTPAGQGFMRDFGIDLDGLRQGRAPLCRDCLDWSERRKHLAGSLGRALLSRIETLGWARLRTDSRIVEFSRDGERAFAACFPTALESASGPD